MTEAVNEKYSNLFAGIIYQSKHNFTKQNSAAAYYTIVRGNKQYELTNHLGNVLATISDRKIPHNNNGVIDYYTADIVSGQDYYPFGSEMPNRTFSSGSYRFGFNGKEKDDEVYGEGNLQDYGMRMYDTRACRFISVDPITNDYPWLTPFQFASNRPIDGIDIDGKEYVSYETIMRYGAKNTALIQQYKDQDVQFITWNKVKYANVGVHLYVNKDGIVSTDPNSGEKITEWAYTDIQVFDETDHVYTWGDNTVTGSQTFGPKVVQNNQNCYVLANKQTEQSGATPTGSFIQLYNSKNNTWYTANVDLGIDYINTELEAGRAVTLGVDFNTTKHANWDGTDHFITISGRSSDANGGYFTFYENAVGNSADASDTENNIIRPTETGLEGSSPNWRNTEYQGTRIQKNSQNP